MFITENDASVSWLGDWHCKYGCLVLKRISSHKDVILEYKYILKGCEQKIYQQSRMARG